MVKKNVISIKKRFKKGKKNIISSCRTFIDFFFVLQEHCGSGSVTDHSEEEQRNWYFFIQCFRYFKSKPVRRDSLSSLFHAAPIQQNGRKSRKLYAVPNKRTKPPDSEQIEQIEFRPNHRFQIWHDMDPQIILLSWSKLCIKSFYLEFLNDFFFRYKICQYFNQFCPP